MLAALAIGSLLALGPTHTEGDTDLVDRFGELVTDLAEPQLREVGVPGLIVGVLDASGEAPRTAFFGFGAIANTLGAPVPTADTLYESGSITKVFTAHLLAQAHLRGELDFDDPIGTLLPEGATEPVYTPGADEVPLRTRIRLADLATHHSGLPRMPANIFALPFDPFANYSRSAMYDFLAITPVFTEPGTNYSYSNYATGLLGCLLERAANPDAPVPYAELLAERITGPLGMASTLVVTPDLVLTPEQLARAGTPHDGADAVNAWRFDAMAGAGAITSTARDLLTFAAASIEAAHAAPAGSENPPAAGVLTEAFQRLLPPRHRLSDRVEVALGWHIVDGSLYMHNGATRGSRSVLIVEHDARVAVVVLINASGGDPDTIAFPLVRLLAGE